MENTINNEILETDLRMFVRELIDQETDPRDSSEYDDDPKKNLEQSHHPPEKGREYTLRSSSVTHRSCRYRSWGSTIDDK